MRSLIMGYQDTWGLMFNYLRAGVLLLCLAPISFAADVPRKLLSAWSTDCERIEQSRWFALESHGADKYMFIYCAGFKCTPYPGFWEPFDVYDDPRVMWISASEMEVSNRDKDAGWEGYIAFHRCMDY